MDAPEMPASESGSPSTEVICAIHNVIRVVEDHIPFHAFFSFGDMYVTQNTIYHIAYYPELGFSRKRFERLTFELIFHAADLYKIKNRAKLLRDKAYGFSIDEQLIKYKGSVSFSRKEIYEIRQVSKMKTILSLIFNNGHKQKFYIADKTDQDLASAIKDNVQTYDAATDPLGIMFELTIGRVLGTLNGSEDHSANLDESGIKRISSDAKYIKSLSAHLMEIKTEEQAEACSKLKQNLPHMLPLIIEDLNKYISHKTKLDIGPFIISSIIAIIILLKISNVSAFLAIAFSILTGMVFLGWLFCIISKKHKASDTIKFIKQCLS